MTPFSDTQGQLDTEMYLLSEVFADDMFVGIMKDEVDYVLTLRDYVRAFITVLADASVLLRASAKQRISLNFHYSYQLLLLKDANIWQKDLTRQFINRMLETVAIATQEANKADYHLQQWSLI